MIRAALLSALWLALAGCQSLPPPLPDQAPAQRTLEVPFHAQQRYQCGPAALAMALGAAGQPATPESLVEEVWLPERRGSLFMELAAAARARDRLAYPIQTPRELFAQLDAGHPVLVMQNLGLEIWPRWHFAVVIGYQHDGESILLHSGTKRATSSHWNRFIRTWARADYRALVVPPPGELPARPDGTRLTRALQDLNNTAGPGAALPYWSAAVERLPEHYLLHFGLGNLHWQLRQREAAIRAFTRATELDPDAPAAWNNLAEAWRLTGCPLNALRAAEKAYALAPENEQVLDTLRAVREAQQAGAVACPLP